MHPDPDDRVTTRFEQRGQEEYAVRAETTHSVLSVLAMPMIGKDLNDATLAHATVPAFVDHTPELVSESFQLADAPSELANVATRDRVDLGARSLRLS